MVQNAIYTLLVSFENVCVCVCVSLSVCVCVLTLWNGFAATWFVCDVKNIDKTWIHYTKSMWHTFVWLCTAAAPIYIYTVDNLYHTTCLAIYWIIILHNINFGCVHIFRICPWITTRLKMIRPQPSTSNYQKVLNHFSFSTISVQYIFENFNLN